MTCDYFLPNYNVHLTPNNEVCGCILGENHEGEHVTQLPNGKFIAWEPDEDCACIHLDDYCDCFVYRDLEDQE